MVAARVVVDACGAAALALVPRAAAMTKHPQLLGVDRARLEPSSSIPGGADQPYGAPIASDGSHQACILGPSLHPSGRGSEGVVPTSVASDGISMTYYDQSHGGATIRLDGSPPPQPDPPYNVIAWRPR